MDAVLEPAKHLLTRDVALEIVRFVASGKALGDEGAMRHGEAVVEPAILSLFCRELNNRRIEQKLPGITMELMEVIDGRAS
ncbi:MAG: hypothetical protein MZV70_34825 [Desulfobacterales bacterium]|nr:hypothetical protein [Desulfobacterales bacterium]